MDPARPFLLDKLNQINHDFGFASYTDTDTMPKWNTRNVFCVCLALMAGTAGLPHVIIRFFHGEDRARGPLVGFLGHSVYLVVVSHGACHGGFCPVLHGGWGCGLNGRTATELPDWYHSWSSSGLIQWVDFNGNGTVQLTANASGVPTAQGLAPNEIMQVSGLPSELRNALVADPAAWVATHIDAASAKAQLLASGAADQPDKDIIVLASPEMAGLADWIIAFMAAGGLAAALSHGRRV